MAIGDKACFVSSIVLYSEDEVDSNLLVACGYRCMLAEITKGPVVVELIDFKIHCIAPFVVVVVPVKT